MYDLTLPVLRAVRTRLGTLQHDGVAVSHYDRRPANPAFPYLTTTLSLNQSTDHDGMLRLTVNVWTDYDGSEQAGEIISSIGAHLDGYGVEVNNRPRPALCSFRFIGSAIATQDQSGMRVGRADFDGLIKQL